MGKEWGLVDLQYCTSMAAAAAHFDNALINWAHFRIGALFWAVSLLEHDHYFAVIQHFCSKLRNSQH